MNTKLIGSLIGYSMNNLLHRAVVLNTLGSSSLVRDEKSSKWIVIDNTQIKWING